MKRRVGAILVRDHRIVSTGQAFVFALLPSSLTLMLKVQRDPATFGELC